jgi:hypothetical protein
VPVKIDELQTTSAPRPAQPALTRRELEAEIERVQRALAERAERIRAD